MTQEHIFYSSMDESFQLEHARRSGSFSMTALHYHNRFEIYYLISGERNYFIHDRVYPVSKGTLVLIGANVLHKTTESKKTPHERILIEFTRGFLEEFTANMHDIDLYSIFNDIHVLHLGSVDRTAIENFLYRLVQENKAKEPGYDSAAKAIFIELLIFIARYLSRTDRTPFAHPTPLHEKISEITKYINLNYAQPLNLEELSRRFYISRFHLSRVFKEITGFSFNEYLNSIRIHEAMRLLLETRSSISDIAEKVGYDSSTHFGRVFKEMSGSSPLQYRKMNL